MAKPLQFLCSLILVVILTASCGSTKQSTYFNNALDTTYLASGSDLDAPIQNNDILSIAISSLSPEASAVFNTTNSFVISSTTASGGSSQSAGYLVNTDGYIQLPILGNIKASGLTKKQLKENITKIILDKKLLIDPIVSIRHLNFEVTVVGEVAKPTVITVPSEKISLIKALGLAGDITIYGKKDNVLLIREIDGKRRVKHIDLNSSSFLTSPYYYLQPNDVVYVESNKDKVASVSRNRLLLPTLLSGLSVVAIVLERVIK